MAVIGIICMIALVAWSLINLKYATVIVKREGK